MIPRSSDSGSNRVAISESELRTVKRVFIGSVGSPNSLFRARIGHAQVELHFGPHVTASDSLRVQIGSARSQRRNCVVIELLLKGFAEELLLVHHLIRCSRRHFGPLMKSTRAVLLGSGADPSARFSALLEGRDKCWRKPDTAAQHLYDFWMPQMDGINRYASNSHQRRSLSRSRSVI